MSSVAQAWSVYRGEDASIVLTGTGTDDPTGWSLLVTVKEYPEAAATVLTTTSVTVGGDAAPFTLTFGLTRAQTSVLTKSQYAVDVWRDDPGGNVLLAKAKLTVLTPVRSPA